MINIDHNHRTILQQLAHQAMLDRGLQPDFSSAALKELEKLNSAAVPVDQSKVRDLRKLPWCSIDNDDSLDLDQLTAAEALPENKTRILVAVADVDALVKEGSAINDHACYNTTSVYTAAEIFSMLPEKLSTGLTSLNLNEDRLAIVIDMVIDGEGSLQASTVCQALVNNHAKLAYNSVASWLDGKGEIPAGINAVQGLADNLRLQDKTAQAIKQYRQEHGALSLETIESKPVFDGEQIQDMVVEEKNRAKEIIEDFMIAANGVTARYLAEKNSPSIRRVVRTPKRWDRIVELANEHGYDLPGEPDSRALEEFLIKARADDPLRFPDLSLMVIKLLGAGEYVADRPGDEPPGHFGLAVKDYLHSTAPNRRYADLITHRLLKAALNGQSVPYSLDELEKLAQHITEQEDNANKVERQVGKSAAALLLESRVGQTFDAIVTGAAAKGTWARLLSFPVEGKVEQGYEGLDVGHRVRVQLISVDVEKGYIDFKRVKSR